MRQILFSDILNQIWIHGPRRNKKMTGDRKRKQMTNFFTRDKKFYISFFIVTLTIALQNAIVYSVNLADNIMIGGYSQTAMSGIAQVNQVQFFLQMITMGAAEGIVVLAARAWGKGDIQGIKKASASGMAIGLLGAVIVWAAMFFFPREVVSLLTNETDVIEQACLYSRIVCFSYVFFAMTNILLAVMRSVETVRIGMYVSLSALVVNIVLNYLLIYGIGIFPEMGARGAAIATLVSRITEFTVVVLYIKLKDKKLDLHISDFMKIEKETMRSYLKVSLPVIASSGIWGIAQGAQASILGHLGEDVIAANSIAGTAFSMVSVAVYGSASASSVIIGKTLGEGRREYIKEYTRTLQILYLGLGLITGLVLFFFKDFIIDFYKITDGAHVLAVNFMAINSVTVVGTAYQMACMTGICRGGGDTKTILINDTIFMWVIVIPLSYVTAFVLGLSPEIVFICLKCDQILKCGVAVIWTNKYKWIRNV